MTAIRKVHRYFAMVLGVFLFIWLASGILMVLPGPKVPGVTPEKQTGLDLSAAFIAPAALLGDLERRRGRALEVRRITLRTFAGRTVYEIHARGEPMTIWDAVTGQRVTVTAGLAERIARGRLRGDVGRATVERLERRTFTYAWGDLPAYRVEFANGDGAIAYVSALSGAVRFTHRRVQAWNLVTGLHEFAPLSYLVGGPVNRLTLLVVALLSLVIVGTGYYLEISPRARGK